MSVDLIHGGALDAMRADYPDAPKPWIDLSTGINPWPYSDMGVSTEAFTRLPSRAALTQCRDAMAAAFGAPPDRMVLAPGSELLIRLLPHILRLNRVAILSPTYGDHAAVWLRSGAKVVQTPEPLRHVETADAVVLCQPNNPDGRRFAPDVLEATRKTLAAKGGWLILDEAYADLTPDLSLAPRAGADGLIVLRSFGKFFGLAGVRLGALIGPPSVREAMAECLGAWPVSGAALEIGARAYADQAWQASMRARLAEAALRLDEALDALGLNVVGGTDLFRLIETPQAHAVFDRLAQQGVYGRRFEWSNRHLRLGLPATPDAQARLVAALSP